MTIIFSTEIENNKRVVKIGKVGAQPTGPWSAFDPRWKHSKNNLTFNTTPKMAKSSTSWFSVQIPRCPETGTAEAGRVLLSHYKRNLSRYTDHNPEWATTADRWSVDVREAKHQKTTDAHSNIKSNPVANINTATQNDFKQADFLGMFQKANKTEREEILGFLERNLGECDLVHSLQECETYLLNRNEEKAHTRKKVAQNRKQLVQKGRGNPFVIKPGDIAILMEDIVFEDGSDKTRKVLFYAPKPGTLASQIKRGVETRLDKTSTKECGFYLRVNALGEGVGSGYRAKKNKCLKGCKATLDILEDLANNKPLDANIFGSLTKHLWNLEGRVKSMTAHDKQSILLSVHKHEKNKAEIQQTREDTTSQLRLEQEKLEEQKTAQMLKEEHNA